MIETFQARNYRCLRNVDVSLTPLHAFIGPNDGGKSTLLRGIGTVVQLGADKRPPQSGFIRLPSADDVGPGVKEAIIGVRVAAAGYFLRWDSQGSLKEATSREERLPAKWTDRDPRGDSPVLQEDALKEHLGPVAVARFDPDALGKTSGPIPEGQELAFATSRGDGLPGIYQHLLFQADGRFEEVSSSVAELFPTLKRLKLASLKDGTIELRAELVDGTVVPARLMSEGLLYYLGFAALRHVSDARVLLVEEPENGLHPSRIADVVRMLRRISEEGTQVLIATHSPLVVNELRPEEVTVVVRPDIGTGTRTIPIRDTESFVERSKIFELGELWLNYADGNVEQPLVAGAQRVGGGRDET